MHTHIKRAWHRDGYSPSSPSVESCFLEQTAKTPLPAVGHVSTCSTETLPQSKLERHPQLFHPLQSSAWAWGSPGAGRGTEAKWVKVEHLSPVVMYLSLSKHVCLHFCVYVILHPLQLFQITGGWGQVRGNDLGSPCPEADGLLPLKGPPQALCSCLTSCSNYHGWC